METYKFMLKINKYKRTPGCLEDIRAIYINGICIVAKNNKHGDFYFSKYVKKKEGVFHNISGSAKYPILFPKTKQVVLHIEDFPSNPKKTRICPDFHTEFDLRQNTLEIIT